MKRTVIISLTVLMTQSILMAQLPSAQLGSSVYLAELQDVNPAKRVKAAMALAKMGRNALPVMDSLRSALKDTDMEVRYWAACCLGSIGPQTTSAIDDLIPLLKDQSNDVRWAAIWSLGEIGAAARSSLPELESLLGDPNEVTRSNAATALVKIGPEAKPVLLKALNSTRLQIRLDVISALRSRYSAEEDPVITRMSERNISEIAALNFPVGFNEGISKVINGSFESEGEGVHGWTLVLEEGATGKVEVVEGRARTGKRCLSLTRTNALGKMYLRSTEPVKMGPDEFAVFRVFFQAEKAPLNATLQLRFDDERGWLYPGDFHFGETYSSQSLLRNTPAGYWDKHVAEYRGDGTEHRVWLRIYLQGNPCTVWCDDVAFPAEKWRVCHSSPVVTLPRFDEQTALTKLRQRKNAEAQLIRKNRRVELLVEGKPLPSVIYQALVPNFADYAAMEQQGKIRIQSVSVDLSDVIDKRYPLSFPVWTSTSHYDFSTPFRSLQKLAATAPDSYVFLCFNIVWPADWVEKHPQDVWLNEKGQRAYGTAMHIQGFGDVLPTGMRWWPSPCSDKALSEAADVLKAFIAQLKRTPYYKLVIGCIIVGGHDGQFYTGWPDYSEPGKRTFQEWLKARYGTAEALRRAWHDENITFETVTIPSSVRPMSRDPLAVTFRDPLVETRIADHRKFLKERGLVLRDYFAGVFKKSLGKKTVAITYQMGGGRGDGVETVFFQSGNLDALVPQPYYELRQPGHIGGVSALLDAYNRHGKLIIKELDMRTWLRSGGSEISSQRQGAAMSPEMFQTINRKEIGQMLARGQGYWYFDIGTTHFRDPKLLEEIRQTHDLVARLNDTPDSFRPDVCVVSDEDSQYACAEDGQHSPKALQVYNFQMLKTSGVPYDQHYLQDILADPELQKYKVYIFEDVYHLTTGQRQAITDKLKRDGKTLVWIYASGFVTDDGLSLKTFSETAGIQMACDNVLKPTDCYATPSNDILASGLPSLQGMGEILQKMLDLPKPEWCNLDVQRFWINDSDATVLAQYRDGKPAIAVKRRSDWISVSITSPGGLEARLLNNIARQAGAFIAMEPGPAMEMSGNFISVHGTQGGRYILTLPRLCTVKDAFSGQVLGRQIKQFAIDVEAQKTYGYLLE